MAPRVERRRRRAKRDLSTTATLCEAQKLWKAGRALPGGGRWALRGGSLFYVRAEDLAPQGRAAERAREVAERSQRKELMIEQLASSYREWNEEGFGDSQGGAQAREDVERALRERSRIGRLLHVCEKSAETTRRRWAPRLCGGRRGPRLVCSDANKTHHLDFGCQSSWRSDKLRASVAAGHALGNAAH